MGGESGAFADAIRTPIFAVTKVLKFLTDNILVILIFVVSVFLIYKFWFQIYEFFSLFQQKKDTTVRRLDENVQTEKVTADTINKS